MKTESLLPLPRDAAGLRRKLLGLRVCMYEQFDGLYTRPY
jgi:hypothetical protein